MNLPSPFVTLINSSIAKYDLWQVVRYGLVGVCAALVHALVALVVFHQLTAPPTLSNFAGYLSGALVSYLGSYYFTFALKNGHSRNFPRFALVWLIGISINVGLFQTLHSATSVPFWLNLFIAIILTPIAQYLMLRFWAFKR